MSRGIVNRIAPPSARPARSVRLARPTGPVRQTRSGRFGPRSLLAQGIALVLTLFSPSASATESEGAYALPAITVTAEKRETEVQKLPMSVTVLSEQQLEDENIRTVQDVMTRVPNLNLSAAMGHQNFMSFRGSLTSFGNNSSPVMIYLDGVPMDSFTGLDVNLLEVERVEVMRGVQTVLYGKNVLGGIINIISKRPGNDYHGKITLRGETKWGYGTSAAISGPLVEDTLFFSAAGSYDYNDGYMKSDWSNDKNDTATARFKGMLLARPSENAEFALHFNYTKEDNGFMPYKLGTSPSSRSNTVMDHDYSDLDNLSFALNGTFNLDVVTVESITTFRRLETNYRQDAAHIPLFMGADSGAWQKSRELTQELRVRNAGEEKDAINWLAGVYGGYTDSDATSFTYIPSFMMGTDRSYREFMREVSAFGQVDVPLGGGVTLSPGVRWLYTHKDGHLRFGSGGMSLADVAESGSWDAVLPKLTLSWSVTDDHMLYTGVSRSYLPGGFNKASGSGDAPFKFGAQKAWNYEAGAKTAWFDRRLTANIAFFYIDTEDMQTMQADVLTNAYIISNAGATKSYGAELDISAVLTEGLTADLAFGYTRATFKDHANPEGTEDYTGNYVQFTPRYTLTAGLTYRHTDGLFVRGEVQQFGKTYWEADNKDARSTYEVVNAKIGYEGETFGAYVYGSNIFGTRYYQNYTPISDMGMLAPTQSFGIELSYKF